LHSNNPMSRVGRINEAVALLYGLDKMPSGNEYLAIRRYETCLGTNSREPASKNTVGESGSR
jgi:hypothetical protein